MTDSNAIFGSTLSYLILDQFSRCRKIALGGRISTTDKAVHTYIVVIVVINPQDVFNCKSELRGSTCMVV